MIYILSIPGAADDLTEIRVLQWHAATGDVVIQDQLIVELESHKAIVEVRAAQAAVMRKHLCEEGEWGSPGRSLGVLSDLAHEPMFEGESFQMAATFEIC